MKKILSSALTIVMAATMFSTVNATTLESNGETSSLVEAVEGNNPEGGVPLVEGPEVILVNGEKEKAVPSQVNVHMGENPSTQVNFTYTTITGDLETKVELNKVGDSNKVTVIGENSIGAANKYFHKIAVSNLEANTNYEYKVGSGENVYNGKFKTAPEKGSKESFKFAYIADTQVANATDAKALGATLAEVNKINDLSFVYMAGDITDTATNEAQWEYLFNNDGAFPTGGQDMLGNNLIAAVQGNHDNTTLNRHINAPAEEGNIVYSYDYGPATFVMLNLETARYDADAREKQTEYLTSIIKEAKERGQWTVVGFHKSLYTGASHITDGDVIEARKYWSPIFSDLDIDMVLQGHDHVYSRGFIDANGYKANPTKDSNGNIIDPENAPLYMVGGHAGGLKWYSKKNYTVGTGDPLAPGYSFLDINSTDTGSDVKKEQVIVEMEISDEEFTLNTYMFKYDTKTDSITTEKYLYDTMTCVRDLESVEVASADISGSDLGIIEINEEVEYTVSVSDIKNTNAFNMEVEYDPSVMEFVKAESILGQTIFTETKDNNGKASIVVGTSNLLTNVNKTDVAKFTFKMKSTANLENTEVKLVKADIAEAIVEDDKVTGAFDRVPNFNTDKVITQIYSYKKASDINKDNKVSLADLSIALANYKGTDGKCDIDLSGIVDTKDFIIISSYIAA